jgi:hypothetical protein
MNPYDNQNKNIQLMLNFNLLSSLNNPKINSHSNQTFQQSYFYPQQIPQNQFLMNQNILSYQNSNFSNNNYINLNKQNSSMSFQSYDDSFSNKNWPLFYNVPFYLPQKQYYTTSNFYLNPLINNNNNNEFKEINENNKKVLGIKTAKNKIIINSEKNEEKNEIKEKFIKKLNFLDEESQKNDNKKKTNSKHKSAPIKLISDKNKFNAIIFETHLLKLQNEDNFKEKKYKCSHPGCDLTYKTKKQLISHHSKMDIECQRDTILCLKLIAYAKKIILNKIKKNILKKDNLKFIIEKYENVIKNIGLKEYAQMICGNNFQDIIISINMNNENFENNSLNLKEEIL